MAAKKREFIETFPKYLNLQKTAAAIDVARSTIYSWILADPEFGAKWKELDFLREQALVDYLMETGTGKSEKPKMPEVTAAIFMLKSLEPRKYREKVFKETNTRKRITKVEIIKDYGGEKISETRTLEASEETASDD